MDALDVQAIAYHPLVRDMARLARVATDTPVAAVCLIDDEGEWRVAVDGLEPELLPDSLAAAALSWGEAVLVISDAATDDRLSADSRMQELGVQTCAATAVSTPEGDVIGSVCVFDTETREFSAPALGALAAVARQVDRHIDRAVEQHHLRDLSIRLVDSERALSQSLERLEVSNRDLELFAFFVAHELQSPLRAVNAFAEVLEHATQGGVLDRKLMLDATAHVQTEAGHLGEKVASLFALSQFSVVDDPRQPIQLEPFLAEVAASFSGQVGTFEIRCDPMVCVLAERVALRTVLTNLLSNAVRYRHPERDLEVLITVSATDGIATIEVIDNGVGIAAEDSTRIFEAFQRVEKTSAGAGVGLTLCRRILEGLGGSIDVSSELGRGTTFTIRLTAA